MPFHIAADAGRSACDESGETKGSASGAGDESQAHAETPMNTHLETYLDQKLIAQWAAERIDQEIENEDKKQEVADKFLMRESVILDEVLQEAKRPHGKLLYQAPTHPVSAASKSDKRQVNMQRIKDWAGWISQSREARWVLILVGSSLAPMVIIFLYQALSWPTRWAYRKITNHEQQTTESPLSHAPLASPVGAETVVPVPQLTHPAYVAGNKLFLHWDALGPGYTYRVFRNCHPENSVYEPRPLGNRDVSTPGALVNVAYDNDCRAPVVQVMALSPNGIPSELSNPVTFRLSLINNEDTVEPLAEEAAENGGGPQQRDNRNTGMTATAVKGGPVKKQIENHSLPVRSSRSNGNPAVTYSRSSPPAQSSKLGAFARSLLNNADSAITSAIPIAPVGQGVIAVKNAVVSAHDGASPPAPLPVGEGGRRPGEASAVPVPSGLTWQPGNDQYVYLQWNSVGSGYRYNIYASLASPVHFTDTENDAPVWDTRVTWTIPKGHGKRFMFVIKAVDAQGRESAPSERMELDLP